MKKYSLLLPFFFHCFTTFAQNVAINNDGSVADNSAILDVKSLSKGVLVPRMSASEKAAIVNPATGLLIYQKDGSTGFYYNSSTPSVPVWVQLTGGAAAAWSLTGNSLTNPALNFLGTTDNQPLIFKHNNKQAARFDYDLLNYFIGNQSGEITSTGRNNVGLGNLALSLNSSGYSNVAIGSNALYWNTNRNNLVAIGDSALFTNGSGATLTGQASYNTAVGSKALLSNTTGWGNTALGYQTLYTNTSGSANTSLGQSALYFNATGSNNTAVGVGAMNINTSGGGNTALGTEALLYNNNGNNNTGLGIRAMRLNTSGYSNVAIGVSALLNNTNRSNLVAIGDSALFNNGTVVLGSSDATANTAIGSKALYSNTRGNANTALGFESLKANTTGYSNTAVGADALSSNTNGSNNTALGENALAYGNGSDNIGIGVNALPGGTGSYNIGIGNESLRYNSSGTYNIAIGDEAMRENSSGSHNVAIGGNSVLGGLNGSNYMTGSNNVSVGSGTMGWNTTGFNNTALGYAANWYNQTGNYNTAIGYAANCGWPGVAGTLVNATAIGTYAIVNQNNSMVLGSIEGMGSATASVNVGIGTIAPQARMHIASNSQAQAINSQLMLEENGDDYTRITMRNTAAPDKFWDLAAYNHTTNANAQMNFYYQGFGDVLSLKGNGNATLSGILTQSSDARLKKNIIPLVSSLSNLLKLNGYSYNWKDESRDNDIQLGLLAQEVKEVFPELVKENEKGLLSVNYNGLIPVMINAIKEQQKQIDGVHTQRTYLQEQLEILKKYNLELKARLEKIEKILGNN